MRRALCQATLAGVLVAAALLAALLLLDGGGVGRASPSASLGIDADPDGNTATSLADIDDCVSVEVGDTFEIDLFITDVEALQVWHVFVRYQPSVVNIIDRDVEMFLDSAPGSDVRDYSYGDPGLSGAYDLLASDVADDPPHESGSGVLARLTLTAVAPGLTAVGIEDPVLWGYPLHLITVDSIANAWVAVGEECPGGPPPTPTPTPTPEPTPTPTATPTPPPAPGLGVDVDPTGNTAASLGPIDSCLAVSTGAIFDVDIFVEGATLLRVWNVGLGYDPSVINVVDRDVQMLLAANSGSDAVDHSYGDSSTSGTYELAAADTSEEESAHESGSGVLARLTLEAVGPGLSPAALSELFLLAYPAQPLAINSVSGGQIAVDRECGPDGDSDGWPDELDNCPQTANPSQRDIDGDADGDACDDDCDNDGWSNEDEAVIGTDPLDVCTDEPDDLDAWPPDIDMSTEANILDVLLYKPLLAGGPYQARHDLHTDGKVNVLDTLLYKPVLSTSCTNP